MKLYHFCADWMLPSILKEGLTLGRIGWMENGKPRIRTGFQWLTSEPDRDKQEWCNPQYSTLPYDRAANRITVAIPKTARDQLMRWSDVGRQLVPPDQFEILIMFLDPSTIYVFNGRIPPAWFRAVDRLGARWDRTTRGQTPQTLARETLASVSLQANPKPFA